MNGERAETGYIDLLYRTAAGWQIVDFKTDIIRNEPTRVKLIEQYKFQMLRYEKAVNSLLGHAPTVCLCFLDDHGVVNLVQASTSQGLLSPSLASTHYSSSDELGD
jgi:ATP-dependent exoDNAse (exonuclease V) beta subunit